MMNSAELTMGAAAVSNLIAKELPQEDLAIAVVVFKLIAENLETIIIQREVAEKRRERCEAKKEEASGGAEGTDDTEDATDRATDLDNPNFWAFL